MKPCLLTAALLSVTVCADAHAGPTAHDINATIRPMIGSGDLVVKGDSLGGLEALRWHVLWHMLLEDIPNAAIAVTSGDGRLVMEEAYSYATHTASSSAPVSPVTATTSSRFRVASVTKVLTAVAVHQLDEAGCFDISDLVTGPPTTAAPHPPAQLLGLTPPPGVPRDSRLDDITIEHLLRHEGGWDRDLSGDPMRNDLDISLDLNPGSPDFLPIGVDDIITHTSGATLDFDPGTDRTYSNYGYALLGRLIEEASGLTYEDYVNTYVLEPVGAWNAELSSSQLADRHPDEMYFYHQAQSSDKVNAWPWATASTAPHAYGGSRNLENQAAHGGWSGTMLDFVRVGCDLASGSPRLLGPTGIAELQSGAGFSRFKSHALGSGYGHTGRFTGSHAMMYCLPTTLGDACISLAFNTQGPDTHNLFNELVDEADMIVDWAFPECLEGDPNPTHPWPPVCNPDWIEPK